MESPWQNPSGIKIWKKIKLENGDEKEIEFDPQRPPMKLRTFKPMNKETQETPLIREESMKLSSKSGLIFT